MARMVTLPTYEVEGDHRSAGLVAIWFDSSFRSERSAVDARPATRNDQGCHQQGGRVVDPKSSAVETVVDTEEFVSASMLANQVEVEQVRFARSSRG